MESKGLEIDEDTFSCPVCLDLLKTPVTIPCGHSYCMSCVDTHWDGEEGKKTYSCPQCRQSFCQRPVLVKNTMLAVLMEGLMKIETPVAAAVVAPAVVAPCSPAQGDAVCCDLCSGAKVKAAKSCLQCQVSYCEEHLQPHYNVAALKKHKLMEPTENLQDCICPRHNEDMKMFCRTDQQCICYLCSMDEHKEHNTVTAAAERTEKHRELEAYRENLLLSIKSRESTVLCLKSDIDNFSSSAKAAVAHCDQAIIDLTRLIQNKLEYVKTEIKCLQEAEDYSLRQVQDSLQQQITEMKTKCSELDSLSHTEDHLQFLLKFKSISKVSDASESVYTSRTPSFHQMAIAIVSKMTKKLQTRQVKNVDPSVRAHGTGSAEQPVVAPPTATPQPPQPFQASEPVHFSRSTQTLEPVPPPQPVQAPEPVHISQSTQTPEPVHISQSTQTPEPVHASRSTQTLESVPPPQPLPPPQPVQAPEPLPRLKPVHKSRSTQTLHNPTPGLMHIIYTDKLADLLAFSHEMNFDADTQHPNLKLSSNNTSVQHVSKKLKYPPHPYRFDVLQQVLSKQRLFGRCFFQVEVQYKKSFMVGVCQGVGNMRTSCGGEEQLGNGPWSYGFGFDNGRCIFLNNCDTVYLRCPEPPTGSPATMRVGVFLDHRAGVLVFYRIHTDDSIVYICEIQNTFWEPLLAGVFLPEINSTAKFL